MTDPDTSHKSEDPTPASEASSVGMPLTATPERRISALSRERFALARSGSGSEASHLSNDRTTHGTSDTTSAFRAELPGELDTSGAADDAARRWGVETLPGGSGVLVVIRGPNAGSRFELDQPVTSAGRNPDSDIFLDDVTVSRHHAEFHRDNGQFQVVDLNSLNRTYVNGKPLHSGAVLANGDQIQIGNFRLLFLTGPATGRHHTA